MVSVRWKMMRLGAPLAGVLSLCAAHEASAQIARSPLLDQPIASIRSEIDKRYEAALAATLSRELVYANDVRFTWASEAKVACGIAIGFLKTRTIDEDSINKCDDYSRRMTAPPPPPPPPPLPPPPPAPPAPRCTVTLPMVFYFEWDVATPPAEAAQVIGVAAQQVQACRWTSLTVAGHADTSGTNDYNQRLSQTRADNVAELLKSAGVPASILKVTAFGESVNKVATGDGVREPLNRRVEITAGGN